MLQKTRKYVKLFHLFGLLVCNFIISKKLIFLLNFAVHFVQEKESSDKEEDVEEDAEEEEGSENEDGAEDKEEE